ncbi:methionine gamma-lyase [Brucella sp. 10RB9215]|nr:methionine gamma-lyase [Brucella sp. 10RB9215]
MSSRPAPSSARVVISSKPSARYGVEVSIIDGSMGQLESGVRPNTKVMFLESRRTRHSKSSTLPRRTDCQRSGRKADRDNVFATPLFQKPLELAHISSSIQPRNILTPGRCLGGVVLSDREWIETTLQIISAIRTGLSPFNAWIMLKGLETLSVRVRQQTQSAAAIADFLAASRRQACDLSGRADHPQPTSLPSR